MALLTLVAGCELVHDIFSTEPQAPVATTEAEAPPPAPAPAPSPPASEVARAQPPAAAVEPRRERAPAPPPEFDPRRLVGLDKDEALALLGQPSAVREQSPSTVWSYRSRDCTLDLFFYMDLATRAFRVLTWDLNTDQKTADSRRACLARIRAASRAP